MMLSTLPRIQSSASRSSALCKSLSSSLSSSISCPPSTASSSSPPLHHSYATCTDTPQQYTTHFSRNHTYNRHLIGYQPDNSSRQFSSSADGEEKPKTKKKKDLRESINRLKGDSSSSNDDDNESNDTTESNEPTDPRLEKLSSMGTSFLTSLSETWEELVAAGQAKDINKKLGTPSADEDGEENYGDDDEAADKYEEYKGSRDIMVVDPEEHLSAWERMERRLRDAPIIAGILETSDQVYTKSGAKEKVEQTQQKMQHIKEDAEEAWETSQNPWVYRASSVYDTLTAETEFAAATRQLQVLDPDFTLENWKRDAVEHTLPNVMKLFLEGRIKELKPWLGEAVYNRLAAESRARKKEGVRMDTNVLAIMNAEIVACEVEGASMNVERGDDPIILLHFMCQQIHCVRKKVAKGEKGEGGGEKSDDGDAADEGEKKEDGKETTTEEEESSNSGRTRTYMEEELGDIVEGSEDDIRANSYVIAFQREYDEKKMELNWKIVDFRFNGAIAYL